MAEQEKKVILTVDTGESQRTVKSLKQEISDLKDAILNLEKGSDEYNSAVEQLTASQRDLNEVQALTKKTATALDGSYDALVHTMSQLKKEWRATADEAKRIELGQEIAKINQELKDLDAELGNYQRNVGNYVSHWEGMPDAVDEISQSTMTFQQRMSEMNQSIEPTKQSFEAVSQLASGLAGGFAAVQGAMALLGKENENLEQTFIKLQAAMALAQGIGGMKGLVEGAGKAKVALGQLMQSVTVAGGGIKGLMKVMGTSGWIAIILAVVSALTLLFKNLPIVKRREAEWETQIRSTVEAQEQLKESIENSNGKLSDRIELLKAQGVEERKLLELQLAQAKANEEKASKQFQQASSKLIQVNSDADTMVKGAFKQKYNGMTPKEAKEHYQQLRDEALAYLKEMIGIREGYEQQIEVLDAQDKTSFAKKLENYADALKEKEQLLREQYERDLALAEKYGMDKTVIEQKYQKDLADLRAKAKTSPDTIEVPEVKEDANETLKKTIQERIKLEKSASDRKLELLDVERQKEIANAYNTITDETKLKEELERINEVYAGKEYNIEQQLLQKKLEILNEWKKNNTDANTERLEIAEEIADTEVEIEKHKQERLTEIAKQGNEDRQQQATASSGTTDTDAQKGLGMIDDFKQQIEDFNDYWADLNFTQKAAEIGNVVNQSLAGASQIFNQLADMYADEENLSKAEQKKIKNLRIAGATMDMLSGIVGAISSTAGMGPIGWALGAIQAGIITTTGIMNIQKIKNTDVTGGSSSSGGGASVTPNIGSYSSELPVNYTRNVTTSSEMDELNKEQRVYILESDIQNSNKKVSIRESESSF